MKNILTAILTIGVLCGVNYYDHNYTRKNCEVVQIDDGLVTVEDVSGFIWDFKGNGFEVGDVVDLKMHDSNTSAYIGDDVVKNVVLREI